MIPTNCSSSLNSTVKANRNVLSRLGIYSHNNKTVSDCLSNMTDKTFGDASYLHNMKHYPVPISVMMKGSMCSNISFYSPYPTTLTNSIASSYSTFQMEDSSSVCSFII